MDFSTINTALGSIAQIIGYATTIAVAIFSVSKKFREKIRKMVRKDSCTDEMTTKLGHISDAVMGLKAQSENTEEALRALLRNSITQIYYENKLSQSITPYEKENVLRMYSAYLVLKGNSYIKTIVEDEINKWDVR